MFTLKGNFEKEVYYVLSIIWKIIFLVIVPMKEVKAKQTFIV